jgi:hypothetical protein
VNNAQQRIQGSNSSNSNSSKAAHINGRLHKAGSMSAAALSQRHMQTRPADGK